VVGKSLHVVSILGPHGAGKTTLTQALSDPSNGLLGFGVRSFFDSDLSGSMRSLALSFISTGEHVPDELVVAGIERFLSENVIADTVLLDGLPGSAEQHRRLRELFPESPMMALYLAVSPEVCYGRTSSRRTCVRCGTVTTVGESAHGLCECGSALSVRPDDESSVALERIRVSSESVDSILRCFGRNTAEVRGDRSRSVVLREARSLLETLVSDSTHG
jgi:adenylate kinase family enzyme